MAEIAIPLSAAPRRLQLGAVRTALGSLIAFRSPREPTSKPCCFGRMGEKDAMVARGLAAASVGAGGGRRP
jgi:hypothetical protein